MVGIVFTSAHAQASQLAQKQNSTGYQTFDEAYSALSRKPGIVKKVRRNLIMIRDPEKNAAWQFTRPGHFAHPSALRSAASFRSKAEANSGFVFLCEAKKRACDRFRELAKNRLSARIKALLKTKPVRLTWSPKIADQKKARTVIHSYLTAIRMRKFREAYALADPAFKQKFPPQKFVALQRVNYERGGGDPTYVSTKLEWFRNPTGLPPGVYAWFRLSCKVPKKNFCEETVVLRRQRSGEMRVFVQMRKFKPN
ncbi:MAG: hypothetical protein CMM52_14635 [Rhodospirillaceae bacterium]|nr:hypothetical protein [Rhodospirillaceae bacterium]